MILYPLLAESQGILLSRLFEAGLCHRGCNVGGCAAIVY